MQKIPPTQSQRRVAPLATELRRSASLPDIATLPNDALLTRGQLAALTGFTEQAFKKWAREGRGPAITYVEGRPRTKVRDFRLWVDGAAQKVAS